MTTLARVLVLDDEPTAGEIVSFHLAQRGCDVTTLTDPRVALEGLVGGGFDLLVTDWMMPGLGGHDLIAALREHPTTRQLPVVVVTAKELDLDEREFLLNQDCVVIQKPFDPMSLFDKVSEAIS